MTFSQRIFQIMLVAYPPEFRREYGPHMVQVFRDCYRAERQTDSRLAIGRLWVARFTISSEPLHLNIGTT